MSFYSLIKGITLKMCMLCFVLINSILFNLSCVWFLLITCFELFMYLDLVSNIVIITERERERERVRWGTYRKRMRQAAVSSIATSTVEVCRGNIAEQTAEQTVHQNKLGAGFCQVWCFLSHINECRNACQCNNIPLPNR